MTTPLSILSSPSNADGVSAARQAPPRNSQTSDANQTFRDTLAEYEPAVNAQEPAENAENSAVEPVNTDSESPVEASDAQSEQNAAEQNDQPSEPGDGDAEANEKPADQPDSLPEKQSEPTQSAPQVNTVQPAQQANVAAQPLPETAINIQAEAETQAGQNVPVEQNTQSKAPVQRNVPLDPVQQNEKEVPVQRTEESVRQQTNETSPVRNEAVPVPQRAETTESAVTTETTETTKSTETTRTAARTAQTPVASERQQAEANARPVEATNSGRVNVQKRNVQTPQAVQPDAAVEGVKIKPDHTSASARRELDTAQPTPSQTPAMVRAAQVETAVRLENIASELNQVDSDNRSAGPRLSVAPTVNMNLGSATIGNEKVEQFFIPGKIETDEAGFSNRVVRGLSTMVNQRGGVMTMRLQPPVLGDLRIQMSIVQGTVNAQFTATTEQAHMLIDRNLTVLRTSLESQGLTVEKLGVQLNTSEQTQNSARNETGEQQQQNQRSSHDAAGGESRGRHENGYQQEQAATGANNEFAAFADSLGSFSFS